MSEQGERIADALRQNKALQEQVLELKIEIALQPVWKRLERLEHRIAQLEIAVAAAGPRR